MCNDSKLRVVGVKFTDGNVRAPSYSKVYHYYTDDPTLDVDDYAVILGGSGAPAIVRVYEVDMHEKHVTKMLIGKVDMKKHLEQQNRVVREHKRKAALKARLEEIKKELLVQSEFKFVYNNSVEAREIMDELGIMPSMF